MMHLYKKVPVIVNTIYIVFVTVPIRTGNLYIGKLCKYWRYILSYQSANRYIQF